MAETVVVDVARDFSRTPGGRYRSDGVFSGEEFREDLIEPKVKTGKFVVIDLDGPVGFTSSFLEEVFGGLVRKFGPKVLDQIGIRAVRLAGRARKAHEYIERALGPQGPREEVAFVLA